MGIERDYQIYAKQAVSGLIDDYQGSYQGISTADSKVETVAFENAVLRQGDQFGDMMGKEGWQSLVKHYDALTPMINDIEEKGEDSKYFLDFDSFYKGDVQLTKETKDHAIQRRQFLGAFLRNLSFNEYKYGSREGFHFSMVAENLTTYLAKEKDAIAKDLEEGKSETRHRRMAFNEMIRAFRNLHNKAEKEGKEYQIELRDKRGAFTGKLVDISTFFDSNGYLTNEGLDDLENLLKPGANIYLANDLLKEVKRERRELANLPWIAEIEEKDVKSEEWTKREQIQAVGYVAGGGVLIGRAATAATTASAGTGFWSTIGSGFSAVGRWFGRGALATVGRTTVAHAKVLKDAGQAARLVGGAASIGRAGAAGVGLTLGASVATALPPLIVGWVATELVIGGFQLAYSKEEDLGWAAKKMRDFGEWFKGSAAPILWPWARHWKTEDKTVVKKERKLQAKRRAQLV